MSIAFVLVPLILLCLVFQGFFSGSEMALVSASPARLEALAAQGNRGARMALTLNEHDENLFGTCLVGTNLSLTTGGTLMVTLMHQSANLGEAAAALAYIPLALIFAESLPKTIYERHADTIAPVVAWPITLAQRVFVPALVVARAQKRLLDRILPVEEDRAVRREDIVGLLDEPHGIDEAERQLVRNIIKMPDTVVEDCMTPLVEVEAIEENAPLSAAIEAVLLHGHSRLPVFRERVDNIIGVVDHRDLLFDPSERAPVSSIVRDVMFVPESKRIHDLLRELRLAEEQFVVVVDEYGGSVGILTLEDLLEEIVGEIRDERDQDEPTIRQLSVGTWRVPARAELDEVSAAIGQALPDGDYETVAGLLLDRLGHIPDQGEALEVSGLRFFVEKATDRAIVQVRVSTMSSDG